MAIVMMSFTLPSDPDALKHYAQKPKAWVDAILSEPNNTEFRAYRSPDGREAVTITEVHSIAASEKFLASDKFKTLRSEIEKAGCSNIKVRAWDVSPLMPNPVRKRARAHAHA